MNKVYIVTAYKFGDRNRHSYNVGVFNDGVKAISAAESHTNYRGGKYLCSVDQVYMDRFDNDDCNVIELYKTCINNK